MEDPDLFRALLRPPDFYAVIGFSFFLLGVGSMWTGKAPGRGGVTYRAKDPKMFWFAVVLYFLGTVWFIGKFLADGP